MKTQIIRLAWQYGLIITIKDPKTIIISHTNGKEMEIVEKDNLFVLKTIYAKKLSSIEAFEKEIQAHFQLQRKNQFITLSDAQINDELLRSTFSNIVVSVVDPTMLDSVTILIEEHFDYSKYKQFKYTVLEQRASAQINHKNNVTEIVIVGKREEINQIIQKGNLPNNKLKWGTLKEPIIFGVSIMNEEEYLKEKIANTRKLKNELENEMEYLEKVHQRQLSSLSWRLTGPLRIITGIIKKIMRRLGRVD